MLVNGQPGNTISIRDRGFLYGDGVFRTLRVIHGKVLHWPLHYLKLQHDCAKLDIICPGESLLLADLSLLLELHPDGVAKLIVTRGEGARGYAPAIDVEPTRVWDFSPMPSYPATWAIHGIKALLSGLRLSSQSRLASVKHLNRLENVLAAEELRDVQQRDSEFAESMLLDADDHLIEGTRSNVFMVSQGYLVTPDLSRCGVAGIQRDRVMAWALQHGVTLQVRDIALDEALQADELFVANSIFGLWPVRELGARHWSQFSVSDKIRLALEKEDILCAD